jgi:hypothetical protein
MNRASENRRAVPLIASPTTSSLVGEIGRAAERVLGRAVDDVTLAAAGANAAVYRIDAGGRSFAAKYYLSHVADRSRRANNEWRTVNFLHDRCLSEVPSPVGFDVPTRLLVLEWIDGVPVTDVSEQDVDVGIGFVGRVLALSSSDGAAAFGIASEACFSKAEIVRQIGERRQGFVPNVVLDRFLVEVFDPLFTRLANDDCRDGAPVPAPRRLVPADFGFHNALRDRKGALRFFDFDYFGWDDPVKLASDFILHPGMALPPGTKARFAAAISDVVQDDQQFSARLRSHLPLFALRWALIVLNRFRSVRLEESGIPSPDFLAAQLAKAASLCRLADAGPSSIY